MMKENSRHSKSGNSKLKLFRIDTAIPCYVILIGIASFISCKSKTEGIASDPDVYYTCSMDPQVIEAKPGKCPICNMQLTSARKSVKENESEWQLSPQQIQLGNIMVDTIRNGSISNEFTLTGVLNFNQLNSAAISARISGRVDKLYFKNTGEY